MFGSNKKYSTPALAGALEPASQKVIEQKLAEKKAADEVARQSKIASVKDSPTSHFVEIFDRLCYDATSVTSKIELRDQSHQLTYYAMIDAMDNCRRVFLEIDRSLLDDKDCLLIWKYSQSSLEWLVRWYMVMTLDGNFGTVTNYASTATMDGKSLTLFGHLKNIYTSLLLIRANQHTIKLDSAPRIEVASSGTSILSFPSLNLADEELKTSVRRLENLWSQARAKSNSEEDEYFLDEVVKTYLPDAWKLYQAFQYSPAEARHEAGQMLAEQLQLIESQIVTILKSHLSHDLSEMKLHTEFLKARTLSQSSSMSEEPQRAIEFATMESK